MQCVFASVLLVIFVFVSCQKSGGSDGGGTTASALIGKDGGELVSSNGSLVLKIPAGALETEIELSIEEKSIDDVDEALLPLGPSVYFELKPDGQTFAQPLSLSLDIDPEAQVTDDKIDVPYHFLATTSEGKPEALQNQNLALNLTSEGSTGVLSGEISHFSPLIVSQESKRTNTSEFDGFYITVNAPNKANQNSYSISVNVNSSNTDSVDKISCQSSITSGSGSVSGELENESSKEVTEGEASSFAGNVSCSEADKNFTVQSQCQNFKFSLNDGSGQNIVVNDVNPSVTVSREILCEESIIIDDDDDGDIGSLTFATGNFETVTNPEGAFVLSTEIFGNSTNNEGTARGAIVVCGSTGRTVHDPETGEIAETFAGSACSGGIPGKFSAFTYGSTGGFDQRYDADSKSWGGGFVFAISQNLTDASLLTDSDGNLSGAYVANNTLNKIVKLPLDTTGYSSVTEDVVTSSNLGSAGLSTAVVSSFSPAGSGAFLAITDSTGSTPGRLIHVVPGTPTITNVDAVGLSPRRVRCTKDGKTCVVSNYSSNTIQIIDWPTRSSAPTIRGSTISVNGPVGIDIIDTGEKILAVATGFGDNTLHVITISAGSATDSSETVTNCTSPGHATFIDNGKYIGLTCNGNSRLVVKKTP